jgi:D-alanine--poly(phosphoribitol) ligase subunit 1
MDLLGAIDHRSILAPERAAHISGDQILTYRELSRRSDLLAAWLLRQLPDDDAPVAVFGHKEPEMLVAFLAAVKAGHPYIPLDSSLPARRVETIIQTARASLLLTPEKVRELILTPIELGGFVTRHPEPGSPWYIIFTSGSTGTPKGVVITRECLESFIDWTLAEQKFVEGQEVFLNQAPFSFDLSVMDLYSSLASGGTLFSLTRDMLLEPKLLYQALASSGVSVWVSTPSFAQYCLADPAFSSGLLPRVRKFWFCGETLAPDVAAGLLERFPRAEVWNTYGPTETTVATTSINVDRDLLSRYSPLPVGRPRPGSRILILDHDEPVSGDEHGEIIIAGPNVSPGYINSPDLTARAFLKLDDQRAYHSGDMGHYQDGLLFFDGRIDFQVKLHGYRIEIGEIEANLCALSNVQDAIVIPAVKHDQIDYLAAFIILRNRLSGSDFENLRSLKRELGQRLPDYMIPRKFIFLPQFPLTINGKADRRKLAENLS